MRESIYFIRCLRFADKSLGFRDLHFPFEIVVDRHQSDTTIRDPEESKVVIMT